MSRALEYRHHLVDGAVKNTLKPNPKKGITNVRMAFNDVWPGEEWDGCMREDKSTIRDKNRKLAAPIAKWYEKKPYFYLKEDNVYIPFKTSVAMSVFIYILDGKVDKSFEDFIVTGRAIVRI